MKHKYWKLLIPHLLLALSILISTWVAAMTSDFGVWVLTGPAIMALSVVAVSALGFRRGTLLWGTLPQALALATVVLAASAILAFRDPAKVVEMLPILGSSAFFGTNLTDQRACIRTGKERR